MYFVVGRAGAYGSVRVPMQPGVHVREVACWRPRGTDWEEWAAWFRGGIPSVAAETAAELHGAMDRGELDTVTAGTVTLELTVVARGFAASGVELGPPAPGAASAAAAGRFQASKVLLDDMDRILRRAAGEPEADGSLGDEADLDDVARIA